MREQMHKKLSTGLQEVVDLRQQKGVVLHMLEQLDAQYAVECVFQGRGFEVVGCNVARYDFEIGEILPPRFRVDMFFLCLGVAEGGDFGFGKNFGEVEG